MAPGDRRAGSRTIWTRRVSRARAGRNKARPRWLAATPPPATASATTSSTSAKMSGAASASSRTRIRAGGCRAKTMPRSGWYRRSRSCGWCRRSCGTGSGRARRRCAVIPEPDVRARACDRRPPRYLLSELVVWGACGSRCTEISADLFGCAARNKGPAVGDNLRNVRRHRLDETVLDGLRDDLVDPELFRKFRAEYVPAAAAAARPGRDLPEESGGAGPRRWQTRQCRMRRSS
jgi:hypothetical protein